MAKRQGIESQEKEILRIAKENGVEQNYLFFSIFERYKTQLAILDSLKTTLEKDDIIVTKEYVKGRENIYTHPAIGEYNKTANAANQTAEMLRRIIMTMRSPAEKEDELINFITKRDAP